MVKRHKCPLCGVGVRNKDGQINQILNGNSCIFLICDICCFKINTQYGDYHDFEYKDNYELHKLKNELSIYKISANTEIKELQARLESIKNEFNQLQIRVGTMKSEPYNIEECSKEIQGHIIQGHNILLQGYIIFNQVSTFTSFNKLDKSIFHKHTSIIIKDLVRKHNEFNHKFKLNKRNVKKEFKLKVKNRYPGSFKLNILLQKLNSKPKVKIKIITNGWKTIVNNIHEFKTKIITHLYAFNKKKLLQKSKSKPKVKIKTSIKSLRESFNIKKLSHRYISFTRKLHSCKDRTNFTIASRSTVNQKTCPNIS